MSSTPTPITTPLVQQRDLLVSQLTQLDHDINEMAAKLRKQRSWLDGHRSDHAFDERAAAHRALKVAHTRTVDKWITSLKELERIEVRIAAMPADVEQPTLIPMRRMEV